MLKIFGFQGSFTTIIMLFFWVVGCGFVFSHLSFKLMFINKTLSYILWCVFKIIKIFIIYYLVFNLVWIKSKFLFYFG